MAPLRAPKRKNADDLPDGGLESSSDDSHGSKRRRRSAGSGNSSPVSSISEIHNSPSRAFMPNQSSQSSSEGLAYQPGSIVRIKLRNFVTYNAVEIFPGPSLNMVIGPNGTGKSTLVCAICIGLGWSPKHLGRQKEYAEFVKNGEKQASIEIELYSGSAEERNNIVRCELKRDGNKAEFFVNGQVCRSKHVKSMARKYSIQIDNLCQFLPQDKVVEFAGMTPIELLKSTQEAVASKEMISWHEDLKQLRSEQKSKQKTTITYEDTLKNLEGRQRMQEADVARMREREQVKENVRLWKYARPFAEYAQAKSAYEEDKQKYETACRALASLNEEMEPSLRAANQKATYHSKIESTVEARSRVLETAESHANTCYRKIEDHGSKINELTEAADAEKRNCKSVLQDRQRVLNSINETRKKMNEPPPEFDAAFHNERINAHSRRISEKNDEIDELRNSMQTINRQAKEKSLLIARAKKELAELDTRAGQQAVKLSKTSPDALKVWNYIKEHKDDFEMPVYGPPIIECSVKDSRYVSMIESLFQSTQFLAITTQTKSDFNKVQDIVYKILRLHNVPIREISQELDRYGAPVSTEEMERYGFDGWAINYIQGPRPVLAMLCDDIKLHQSGISLKDTTSDQYKLLEDSHISSWASEKSVYRIARRKEYGPGAVSTTVRDTRPAQFWNAQPIDAQAKKSIESQLMEWSREIEEMKEALQSQKGREQKLHNETRILQDEQAIFNTEKDVAKKEESLYRALPTKMEQFEKKLTTIEEQRQAMHDKVFRHNNEINRFLLEKGQATIDYVAALEQVFKLHDELFEAEFTLIEARSDQTILAEKNQNIRDRLKERETEIEQLNQSQRASKKRAAERSNECKRIHGKLMQENDIALLDFIRQQRADQTSVEIIDGEIAAQEARLELMHEGSGRIIEEFEDRERKINEYREKLRGVETGINMLQTQIADIRSKWEPQLDTLIDRISNSFAYNMKQINCAGEVSVDKEEDFDRWAVSIKVKFREEEILTQLDSHRQSGGERAVSTIFYLMSLQSLTRSPFRVVDEINQGMDPRNERLVHSRMVAIATGNDEWLADYDPGLGNTGTNFDGTATQRSTLTKGVGSQYFLITPKLLHGLRYEPGMKVLCIASGEFMPDNQTNTNFARSLAIRKTLSTIPAIG